MKQVFANKRNNSDGTRMSVSVFICIMLALLVAGCSSELGARAGKKVLIYTKNGKGFVHKNIPESIRCIESICRQNGWVCQASDDPSIFTTKRIAEFDVLVFSNTNNQTFDTDEQREVFQKFIQNGGGFAAIHSACASERQWPWYWANVGCKFVFHPPFQKFDVKVVDKDHPSTEFLPDIWKWEDECYIFDHLSLKMNVLLAGDLRTIKFKEGKPHPGKTFVDYVPI